MDPLRSKQDVKDAFVTVVNAVEPDHPYQDRAEVYPISHDDIDWSYKKHSGRFIASCGPRRYSAFDVSFAGDWKALRESSPEKLLAVLVHEASHIPEGSHTDGSAHNPAFWREVTFYASELLDSPDAIDEAVDSFDRDNFIAEVIEDPNSNMVDGRVLSLAEQRKRIAQDLSRCIEDQTCYKLRRAFAKAGLSEATQRVSGNSED